MGAIPTPRAKNIYVRQLSNDEVNRVRRWMEEGKSVTFIKQQLGCGCLVFRKYFPNYEGDTGHRCQQLYSSNPKKCIQCSSEISYKYRKNKFCSHTCGARFNNNLKYGWLQEIRKQAKLLRDEAKEIRRKGVDWTCPVCKKTINISISYSKKIKFCSGTCRNKVNNQLIKGKRSKAEKHLEEQLKIAFPTWEIEFNNRKILNGLELDVYIPHLKLAIEWNGIFHLQPVRNDAGFFEKMQLRDQKKANTCKELGINLLTICDRTSSTRFIRETVAELVKKLKQL